jgi:hypothetical protein
MIEMSRSIHVSCRSGLLALVVSGCAVGSGSITRTQLAFEAPVVAPGWLKIETPEFTLHTDLDAQLAERAAQALSQSLTGLRAMFGKAPMIAPMKLEVYALKDDLDFERRFGKRLWGFASSSVSAKQSKTVIVLYGAPDRWFVRSEINYEGTQSVLQHELAHAVLRQYFQEQPQWFAEGMAEYLETFRWVEPELVRFGDPNLGAYREYRAIRSLSVAQLLKWQGLGQRELEVAGLYGLSWALVHFGINKLPREFGQYMAVLAQRGPHDAWGQTFAAVDQLDQAIFKYMSVGEYQFRQVRVPLVAPLPATLRPMTADELAAKDALFESLSAQMRANSGS